MPEQSNAELINRLMAQLREPDVARRLEAIAQFGRLDVMIEPGRSALKAAAADDSDASVRDAAYHVLVKFGLAKKREIISPPKWLVLFVVGFVGWYVIHTVVWGAALVAGLFNGAAVAVWILLIAINILGILVLAAVRFTRMAALGAISAFAFNLAITMILGMFVNAICFVPPFLMTSGP